MPRNFDEIRREILGISTCFNEAAADAAEF